MSVNNSCISDWVIFCTLRSIFCWIIVSQWHYDTGVYLYLAIIFAIVFSRWSFPLKWSALQIMITSATSNIIDIPLTILQHPSGPFKIYYCIWRFQIIVNAFWRGGAHLGYQQNAWNRSPQRPPGIVSISYKTLHHKPKSRIRKVSV